MVQPHFLLVTFPAQGHINPALQFAKRLIHYGVHVTFATCVSAYRRMAKSAILDGLSFAAFSDGYDDGFKHGDDPTLYFSELKRRGSQTIAELIETNVKEGRPITCLVYTLLLPWVAQVARAFHLRSSLLWIEPATVLDIYYYYFYGYGETIKNNCSDRSGLIELPGLPPMTRRDFPTFIMPADPYAFALPIFQQLLETLSEETNPKVLVNTFDALESEALKAIEKFNLIGIGPLVPSAFLDEKDPSDTSFGGDLFQGSNDDIEWLNSRPHSSVIYISFGSLSVLSKRQAEEVARGVLETDHPFLWVIRATQNGEPEKEEDKLSCREELEQQGMIVPWCSQVEVLSHPSIACFVTHCGWNLTLESLVSGVPVVVFPQWADQGTNAKLIKDVWKTGVRVAENEEGIVESQEIKRCLDLVMGNEERGQEMRLNARKWKELAREAAKEGGSSDRNLKTFVDEAKQGC